VVLRRGWVVTVGLAPGQADLMKGTAGFVAGRVRDDSVWAVLHRECHVLFPDEMFADLFAGIGRRSVPPRIVATVMVLQRLFGLSDREAVEAFEFDARWKYACGGLDFDYPGFAHTVLVDMRARWGHRRQRSVRAGVEMVRAVGPIAGTSSCEVEHVGTVVSGRAAIAMDDGETVEVGAGDPFHVPPGHDSWVVGDEPYVSLHVLGAESYAAE
jgi:hypothetical protein